MNWAQAQRQKFIAARLRIAGFINRGHLMAEFGISRVQASVDLRKFSQLNPSVMKYNMTTKRYEHRK